MYIEEISLDNGLKLRRLIAEENMRLTNEKREFYVPMVYLGSNDDESNYTEVSRAIWKNFVEETTNDYVEQVIKLQDNLNSIEETLLDTDYKLLCLELNLE